jgi:hypothetical protein
MVLYYWVVSGGLLKLHCVLIFELRVWLLTKG